MSILPTQMGLPICLVPSKLKYKPNPEALGEPSKIHGFQEIRPRSKETVGWIKFIDPIPFLLFGRDLGASHVFVGHPSISNQHAVAFWDRRSGLCMIQDLESESGTFVNGKLISHLEPTTLNINDTVRFGASAHVHVFAYLPIEYRDEELQNAQTPSLDARTEASGLPPPSRRLSGGTPPPVPASLGRSPPGSEVERPGLYPPRMGPPRMSTPLMEPRPSPGKSHEFSRSDDRDRGMDSRWGGRPMGRGEPMDSHRRLSSPPPSSGRYIPERGPSSPPYRRDPRHERYDDRPVLPPPPPDHRLDRRPMPPDDYAEHPMHPRPYPPRRSGPPDGRRGDIRDYDRERPPMRDFDDRGGGPPPDGYRGRNGRDYDYDRPQDGYRPRGDGRGPYNEPPPRRPRSRGSDGF